MTSRDLGTGLGGLIVGAFLLTALGAEHLAPYDPFAQDLMQRMIPPQWMDGGSALHPFCTDQLGRDYLSRLIFGTRISMLIGSLTVVTSGVIGITLGVVGGYFGGRIDDLMMFIITCRLSIPPILMALTVVALVGSWLTVVVLTLGLLLWERFAVVARATTMQVRNLDYVAAAHAAGASTPHIGRHFAGCGFRDRCDQATGACQGDIPRRTAETDHEYLCTMSAA